MVEIIAHVQEIHGNRMGDKSEKIRISASYETAGMINSITFDEPIDQASSYHIGQQLTITIKEKGVK